MIKVGNNVHVNKNIVKDSKYYIDVEMQQITILLPFLYQLFINHF